MSEKYIVNFFKFGRLEATNNPQTFTAANDYTAAFMAGMWLGERWVNAGGYELESPLDFINRVLEEGTVVVNDSAPALKTDPVLFHNVLMTIESGSSGVAYEGRSEYDSCFTAGIGWFTNWVNTGINIMLPKEPLFERVTNEVTITISEPDYSEDIEAFLESLFGPLESDSSE